MKSILIFTRCKFFIFPDWQAFYCPPFLLTTGQHVEGVLMSLDSWSPPLPITLLWELPLGPEPLTPRGTSCPVMSLLLEDAPLVGQRKVHVSQKKIYFHSQYWHDVFVDSTQCFCWSITDDLIPVCKIPIITDDWQHSSNLNSLVQHNWFTNQITIFIPWSTPRVLAQ